ncbi:MAG: HlyC/CorC family transporter [Deltaproteobacteria bacterium]|nr:HlyC/CorC family transporter [Deltaproteobacteria bacterium]
MDETTLWLLSGAVALLLLRAASASLEAALVAVGLPRAQKLAGEHGAGRRARALAALLQSREDTEAARRTLDSVSAMGAAVLSALAAWRALPGWAGGVAAGLAVVVAALVSLAMSAGARGLGARQAEPVALGLALPARGLAVALAPAGRLAGALSRLLGLGPGRFSLPQPPLDEMERALAEYAQAQGGSGGQSTSELIHRVFEFRETVARDVMVPRTEVVAVDVETPVPELLLLLSEQGHSRLPVYAGSLDHVVGTLHVRDLVPLLQHPELIVLRDLLRPATFVPWTKPVEQLLREMQRRRLHMAMVVDEYGGVMGLCTLEDVLEVIVGDIGDEFEEGDRGEVEPLSDGTFTARGSASLAEFNRVTGAGVPEGRGSETVGGFVTGLAGAIPSAGDRLFWRGWVFTVSEATPRRVGRVRAARVKRQVS